MRLKYFGFLGAFLILAVLLLNISSVSAQTCWVETEGAASCTTDQEGNPTGYHVTMWLSESANAHGAKDSGSYTPVLCCSLGFGDTTCSENLDPLSGQPENKFLGLSSSTNAHAEAPHDFDNYGTDACYDSFEKARQTDEGCGEKEVSVLFISSPSNSHIEDPGLGTQNYNVEICAKLSDKGSLSLCELTSASWKLTEVSEGTVVDMVVEGDELYCEGQEISFEVFRNGVLCNDCDQPANVNFPADGNATGNWTAGPAHNDKYTFVAIVVGNEDESVSSINELLVTENGVDEPKPDWCEADTADGDGRHEKEISLCDDYETETACSIEQCITANYTVESDAGYGKGDDFCDEDRNCECYWDLEADEGEKCDARWSTDSDVDGGTCTLKKQDVEGSCADGDEFITFSYTAEWEWHEDNDGIPTESGEECQTDDDCQTGRVCDDDDGLCYLDSENQRADCEDGSRVAMCPAEIALPFFNVYSFLITILLIVAVYLVWNMVKSEKKTHKKSKSGSRKKRKR